MRLVTWTMLAEFADSHADAYTPLKEWAAIVKDANWSNFAEMRSVLPAADSVGENRFIFNIGGNKYRLICAVSFKTKFVLTKWVGTHAEYNKIDPKEVEP